MDTVATSSASFSPPKKRKRLDIGHLSVAEKQCVLNMYKQLRTDEPNLKKTVIVSKISNTVGVAQSTVYRTIKEYNETGTVTASKHYGGRPVGSVINCLIENTGKITNRASVSLEAVMNVPLITKEDTEAIEFCGQVRASFIFVPYAEQADTIKEVKKLLGKQGRATMVVAKIENVAGVYNIDNLISVSDAILISRCALASELSPEKVVVVQKMITGKCNKNGVPVILAPSVLQSMATNPIPNSSEIADVTSSVTDGVDCFMLSRETAMGAYPVESIKALDAICRTAEPLMYQKQMFHDLTITTTPIEPLYAIAISAVEASMKCNAAAILVTTVTGRSAKLLSRFRPRCPIIAITRYAHVARFLNMWRAVDSVHYLKKPENEWSADLEKRLQFGLTYGKLSGYIRTGDAVVLVTGSRIGTGFTNGLKIVYASEFDTTE